MEENKNLSLNKNLVFFIGLKDGAFNFNFFFVLFFLARLQTVPFLYLSPWLDRERVEGFFS